MLVQTYGSQNLFYGSQGYAEWMLVIIVNDAEPLNMGPVGGFLALRLRRNKEARLHCQIEEVLLEKLVVSLSRCTKSLSYLPPEYTREILCA